MRSTKLGKQRKFLHQAPLHRKRKLIASHLSKELRMSYKRRSISLAKGDEVQIMRGEHKGKTGKISKIDTKKRRIYIEGLVAKRTIGTEKQISFDPSNLRIMNLNLADERRRKIFLRKVKEVKYEKPKEEKPAPQAQVAQQEAKAETKAEAKVETKIEKKG